MRSAGAFRFTSRALALVLTLGFLSGCGTLHYLAQAAKGQLSLLNHARPIPDVIRDEKTPPRVKVLLSEIEPIKRFGEKNGLKATSNYKDFVKLDRKAAVWVVSACEKLHFKSLEWSFPIVGSFPYLGWFDLKDAQDYQKELEAQGWDVDLRGAGAYSTLGWFPDAILSTMIPEGPEALGDLVNVVIHESVHATLYVKGQAYFNESIASFVADGLTKVYLKQSQGETAPELKAYEEAEKRGLLIRKNFYETYLKLDQIYSSDHSDAQKLEEKEKVLTELKTDLNYKRNINNATLIQYKTYNTGQTEFERILKNCDGDWRRFMAHLSTIKPESFSKLHEDSFQKALEPWMMGVCPAKDETGK